ATVDSERCFSSPERELRRLKVRECLRNRVERLVSHPIRCGRELPHLCLVETPRDARIEAPGKGRTAMRVGRKKHHIRFCESMPTTDRFHDLAMLFTRKDVNVGADQDAAMSRLVFECESSSPEVGAGPFRWPYPPSHPSSSGVIFALAAPARK